MVEFDMDEFFKPKPKPKKQYNKDNKEMIIYLLQLHVNLRGKDYLLKYVGQTINFKARQKAHLRDLKTKWKPDMTEEQKISYTRYAMKSKVKMAFDYFSEEMGITWRNSTREQYSNLRYDVANAINKAVEDGEYNFSILHRAESKEELNCAEFAYMFMLDPQMNSMWSEANCHDMNCNICKHYGFWGHPNGIGVFKSKWHWPMKPMVTDVGMNNRRKYLRSNIKQSRSQITFERKWKAGWLPNDVDRLWKEDNEQEM